MSRSIWISGLGNDPLFVAFTLLTDVERVQQSHVVDDVVSQVVWQ